MAAKRRGRRKVGYLTRQYRSAKRSMTPNRVAARLISGGRHQTFTSIAKAPFRTETVTAKQSRQRYRAQVKREQRAATAERKRQRAQAVKQRRDDAKYAASVRKASAARRPKPTRPVREPFAIDPRTGKTITWRQAQKGVREAEAQVRRIERELLDSRGPKPKASAAGAKRKPAPAAKRATPARRPVAKPAPRTKAPTRRAKRTTPRRRPADLTPPDPAAAPGKNLRGVYYAATCPCQGTGRIAVITSDNRVTGSVSCPKHGRKARGSRKTFARRAMTNAGLPGVAAWLASRESGNRDKRQRRAARQAERRRYAGPTQACRACDEGLVNRDLTEKLRAEYIGRVMADRQAAGRRALGERKLDALARAAYPYDHCHECAGLGRVPSERSGEWLRRTNLPQRHRLTARQRAAGTRRT